MPVKHISNYAQFVDGIFNEYKARSLLDKEFKTIASVEIEIKKLQKMVSENYALNSMRGSTVSVQLIMKIYVEWNWTVFYFTIFFCSSSVSLENMVLSRIPMKFPLISRNFALWFLKWALSVFGQKTAR